MNVLKRLNSKGFSLAEVTTVVIIMGILASIGISNYTRMKRKRLQAEAKAQLGVLHSRMTNFQTEWGDYWGVFVDINYSPKNEMTYNVGFNAMGSAVGGGFAGNMAAANEFNTMAACGMSLGGCLAADTPALNIGGGMGMGMGMGMAVALTWQNASFTAGARGSIGGTNGDDEWTIDEVKVLLNVNDGTL